MNKRRFLALTAAVSLVGLGLVGAIQAQTPRSDNAHLRKLSGEQVVFRIGDKAFTVDLYDNPTAADLLPRLPLIVKANNYAGYDEKVIRLPVALSMDGAPPGDDPLIPEVGYYQPGQWIALYYGPIGYWSGKVPLGKIDASIEELRAIPDDAPVTIEAAK